MKRALAIAALTAVAAGTGVSGVSAETSAKAGDAASRGGSDLKITFNLRLENGKPVQVRKFRFSHLTTTCDVGNVDVKGKFGRMNVNDAGKFDGKLQKNGAKVVVEGDSNSEGTKVKGTLLAKGDFNTSTGCDSGKVKWIAGT
jgi:hypothetical protein